MNFDNFWLAFFLTLFAGLATGVGSLLALVTKTTNKKFLSFSLGLSAGVMIYVSLVEIFPKAKLSLVTMYGDKLGYVFTVISFFAGILLIALIDKLIPSIENPHEIKSVEDFDTPKDLDVASISNLKRMGIFTAIAIAIHNFPEGLATFIGALENPQVGLAIAFAIAIHNIPEGISVAIPIYYATKSRRKAFIYSFLSGLAEPVGALIGFFLFRSFLNEIFFGVIFALVAGIMVFISLDELLPTAREYGEHHISIYGLVTGMLIMAVSLLLF